ncbi:conserved hypothetical protein [Anaeromyxobacter dehalogenans 2CP-1]|uniref:Uncharacterized protein n=1 Tax=Anaeromyxobacter dehalogenans (strain ATCC BAA-258 / DSM 21875 / 2CP-1) TaxID=455488 RepID=B8JEG9_ANAD2|nr:hypothetical protein [Anaeromyxobacter dehalogenans]ACL64295.1 conserved hypothetical protein [Anaeromyxobacter dehalogenans 2CP-1]
MATVTPRLHAVAAHGRPRVDVPVPGDEGTLEDLLLIGTLFAIACLPLVGAAAHFGQWTQGELGLAAAGTLFTGRHLWASAGSSIRAGKRRHRRDRSEHVA